MTQFQVDSDAVLQATTAVQATISRIQTEVGGLQGQLNSLESVWTGQAATAFQAIVAEWRATQIRVEEGLASINSALTLAGTQYADIEQSNARLFLR